MYSILKYHYPAKEGILRSITQTNVDHQVLFKPYYNSGERIPAKRMYIANSFVVGRDLEKIQTIVDAQKVEVEIL